MGKTTLTFKEFCEYLRIGKSTAGRILSAPNDFAFKCGTKWRILKDKLDGYIEYCAKNNINMSPPYDKMIHNGVN